MGKNYRWRHEKGMGVFRMFGVIFIFTLMLKGVTLLVQGMESLVRNTYEFGYAFGSLLEKVFN